MNLAELRQKIDAIDDKIVALINERCKLAAKIGEWKKQRAHAIYVPEREKQLFERLHAKNEGPISSSALRSIYREIISGAIALEKPLKIICFDSKENSGNAARETFGDAAKYTKTVSMTELLAELNSNKYDYGAVPLADSAGNFVQKVISELIKHPNIKICAERIGSVDGSGGRYFIIGRQETTPSTDDRTAFAIEPAVQEPDWPKKIKAELNGFKLFSEAVTDTRAVFFEISGHPADEKVKKLLETLAEKTGKVQILGGYPVLYA